MSTRQRDAVPAAVVVEPAPPAPLNWAGFAGGLAVVLALGIGTHLLTEGVPAWTKGTAFGAIAKSIEFPIYAIVLGLLGNLVLTSTGLRDRLLPGFRTEFFIKTGLVLLGASINFAVIVRAAGPAIAQAVLLISFVFFFTWWIAGPLGVDDRLRALLSTAVSICGVSAAIAAAGAVKAKKEDLAYTASLVILFALPAIFVVPWLASLLGLSDAVTGAWIGGNIDTTAAVTAAGTLAGEQALQIATIVKVTQNALLGVAAILLTLYFTLRVERNESAQRPGAAAVWQRFRLRDHHDLRRQRPGGGLVGDHRGGERPAHLVPDPGLRQHRAGVQRLQHPAVRLASGRRVRRGHRGQPGDRPRPLAAAVQLVRVLIAIRSVGGRSIRPPIGITICVRPFPGAD